MTPGARVQAAMDLLDQIIVAARDGGAAADVIATRFFRERRYAGSADRRAVRQIAWDAIRQFGNRPSSGRTALVAMADADEDISRLFTGEGHAPAPIVEGEPRAVAAPVAEDVMAMLDARIAGPELDALLQRAPLDLRINRARLAPGMALPDGQALPAPVDGLRLPADTRVSDHPAYLAGAIEIQDLASQWVAHICQPAASETVVDLCAGAGGKALALAAAMNGQGRLIACDTDRGRLQQVPPRAERAGAAGIECRLLNPGREEESMHDILGTADLVLVDAPCSGSGTWRRNPEARWRLTRGRMDQLVALQARLLELAMKILAPRGRIVYAVCSIMPAEGEEQVNGFLARHPDMMAGNFDADMPGALIGRPAGPGRLLTPLHDGCDGFFVATLRRSA